MKRLVCFLVIMLCASPAFSTTLTKIPTSQIGETVTTIAGKSSGASSLLDAVVETTIALNNSGALKTATNGAALTIPFVAKRAIPALGTAFALGYVADCAFDLIKAYNNDWLKDYPLLDEIVSNYFGDEGAFKTPDTSSVAQFDSNNYIFKYYLQEGYPLQTLAIVLPAIEWVRQSNGSYWLYQNQTTQTYVSNGTTYYA